MCSVLPFVYAWRVRWASGAFRCSSALSESFRNVDAARAVVRDGEGDEETKADQVESDRSLQNKVRDFQY